MSDDGISVQQGVAVLRSVQRGSVVSLLGVALRGVEVIRAKVHDVDQVDDGRDVEVDYKRQNNIYLTTCF